MPISIPKFRKPAGPSQGGEGSGQGPAETVRAASASSDLDLRLIWQALVRRRAWILVPTVLALVLSLVAVNLMTPRYKSEARILIDGRENVFLRPNNDREERATLDPEAVTSQVQLLLSRDLAREVIKKNKLAERPEFDPVLRGVSRVKTLLSLLGLARDPLKMTADERVLEAYYERLVAYAVDKSRVMVVEFMSSDPELAARVAGSIAEGYLVLQQAARQDQAKAASQWLAGEIDSLRKKVEAAEAKAEDFRAKSSLFVGTNNTTLSNQQLGEINTQLNNARAQKSESESKARLIRDLVQRGQPLEASEVLNSELIRRLAEQIVTLRAQLAEQSSTLLGAHPRIKELKAQLADLDRQLRDEALKVARTLENDARIAGAKVEALTANLDQLKRQATSSNSEDVQLRALEREARAERELLESYLAKYREATTRENLEVAPLEGRIISRPVVSNTPAAPKKLPIVLIATLATFMLTAGFVASSELLRMTAPAAPVVRAALSQPPVIETAEPAPVAAPAAAAATVGELEQLAAELRAEAVGKVTMLGSSDPAAVTRTALALARLLADDAKVVLVDLSATSAATAEASNDPDAPGLSDLLLGNTSFGDIITTDKASRLHLVGIGREREERALLASPRLVIAMDALGRAYDHIILDAGRAADLPVGLLASQSRAVVIPDAALGDEARKEMQEQLLAVGFNAVTMLDHGGTATQIAHARAAA
ncbi:MAG TPA: exopolysaccharide transport family protein [Xanthobacteraceae bacterium]|nr:exopolysaccharide transport family protein [Xanthobacteraceae bacterium]